MPVTLSVHDLVARAQQRVTTLSPDDVAGRRHDEGVLIVDVRDVRDGGATSPPGRREATSSPRTPSFRSLPPSLSLLK